MNAPKQRNREPAKPQPDQWDVWIGRLRKALFDLVFPIIGVVLIVAIPEKIQANPWSWAPVAGLIFSPVAGFVDRIYRTWGRSGG